MNGASGGVNRFSACPCVEMKKRERIAVFVIDEFIISVL
jgi:hypothetical protein